MAVDIARIAFAQRQHRKVTVEDLSVQVAHPLSTELTFTSYISSQANATTFANFLLGLLKVHRFTWSARVKRENYSFQLGDTVRIVWPRLGLASGGNFIVKRIRNDVSSPFLDVSLYGPE